MEARTERKAIPENRERERQTQMEKETQRDKETECENGSDILQEAMSHDIEEFQI